jgi:hydrogenase maturation protease
MSPISIIGIGNEDRGDDAVGLLIARTLRELDLRDVVISEHVGEGTSLLAAWQVAESVIIIDAVKADALPGTLVRFDARTESLPTQTFAGFSHAFGVAEAIELGRALQRLPSRLIVFGIVGEQFASGASISPAVLQAIPHTIALVLREIELKKGGNR